MHLEASSTHAMPSCRLLLPLLALLLSCWGLHGTDPDEADVAGIPSMKKIQAMLDYIIRHASDEHNPNLPFIPRFEPLLYNDSMPLDLKLYDDLALQGTVSQIELTGLGKIKCVVGKSFFPVQVTCSWSKYYPLNVTGLYNVQGNLGNVIPIFGEGDLRIGIRELELDLAITVNLAPIVQLKKFNLTDLSISGWTIDLENFMGGGEEGDLMCDILTDLGPRLVSLEKEKINALLGPLIPGLINPEISFSISDIDAFLNKYDWTG